MLFYPLNSKEAMPGTLSLFAKWHFRDKAFKRPSLAISTFHSTILSESPDPHFTTMKDVMMI